jgi:hypothetical protein
MNEHAAQPTQLAPWETWPIWALGLSNGLNLAIWYVVSMLAIQAPGLLLRLPGFVNALLPLLIVAGAVATAISLDGVLVATLAGMRGGRRGAWSWLTIAGAGLFSGAIAWAVHSGQSDTLPGLHVAQAVVLVLYNLHLSQPKTVDTEGQNTVGSVHSHSNGICKSCGGTHAKLSDYSACSRQKRQLPVETDRLPRLVPVSKQGENVESTDGVNTSEV